MRFFFKSRKFSIFIISVAVVLVLSILIAVLSSVSSPISSVIGTVTSPVQKALHSAAEKKDGIVKSIGDNKELLDEIERLKKENAELSEKLVDYDNILHQNEFYEQYLGIKEKNTEMLFQSAKVISYDSSDPYKGFSIDVGLVDGVSLHDPVVTEAGLVGYVTEIAPTYSKITTVLSPKLKAGGVDSRTSDEGLISGRADLSGDNKCYFYNLQRTCSVSVGDFVVTSGGSVFPKGLIVGKVIDIKQNTKDTSLYAVLSSGIDFDDLSDVMVITYFGGQGSVGPEGSGQ